MKIRRPHIILENIQVKSLEKARLLAAAVAVIERECGIHETRVTIRAPFICPWMDLTQLDETHEQRMIRDLLIGIDRKMRGKDSQYHKQGEKDARPENSSL